MWKHVFVAAVTVVFRSADMAANTISNYRFQKYIREANRQRELTRLLEEDNDFYD